MMSGCIVQLTSREEDRNPAQSLAVPGTTALSTAIDPSASFLQHSRAPWLSLVPACMRTQQCPSESSGAHSGENCSSSGSSGLSPGSDSDSSGVVCGGGGMRGVLSRYWSLESLHSATGKKIILLL